MKPHLILERAAWDELQAQVAPDAAVPEETHALLVGDHDGTSVTVSLVLHDDDEPRDRARKRKQAVAHDWAVVGQAMTTYDTTRTTTPNDNTVEEEPRDGHVFLHLHSLAGMTAICAFVVQDQRLAPLTVTIVDHTTGQLALTPADEDRDPVTWPPEEPDPPVERERSDS